jgi:hypothetical protein
LSVTPRGSPDVNGCVAFQIPKDFTAHLEMHPLKQGSLQEEVLKKMLVGITCIHLCATCLNPSLCHLEEPKWLPIPTKTNHTSLQGVPQKNKRGVNADRKQYKQIKYLKDVQVCNVASNRRVQYMSLDYIRKNIVVCDGGDTTSNAIKKTSALNSVHYL